MPRKQTEKIKNRNLKMSKSNNWLLNRGCKTMRNEKESGESKHEETVKMWEPGSSEKGKQRAVKGEHWRPAWLAQSMKHSKALAPAPLGWIHSFQYPVIFHMHFTSAVSHSTIYWKEFSSFLSKIGILKEFQWVDQRAMDGLNSKV